MLPIIPTIVSPNKIQKAKVQFSGTIYKVRVLAQMILQAIFCFFQHLFAKNKYPWNRFTTIALECMKICVEKIDQLRSPQKSSEHGNLLSHLNIEVEKQPIAQAPNTEGIKNPSEEEMTPEEECPNSRQEPVQASTVSIQEVEAQPATETSNTETSNTETSNTETSNTEASNAEAIEDEIFEKERSNSRQEEPVQASATFTQQEEQPKIVIQEQPITAPPREEVIEERPPEEVRLPIRQDLVQAPSIPVQEQQAMVPIHVNYANSAKKFNSGDYLTSQAMIDYFSLLNYYFKDVKIVNSLIVIPELSGTVDQFFSQILRDFFHPHSNQNATKKIFIPLILEVSYLKKFFSFGYAVDHIVCICIDIENKSLEYYNSQGGLASQETRTVKATNLSLNKFIKQLENICNKMSPDAKFSVKSNQNIHQRDYSSCGAYVANFVRERLLGSFERIIQLSMNDANTVRRKIAQELQRKIIIT